MNKKDYKRLGDYIREVDVRNKDLKVKQLMGININKLFMPSVANVIGTDLSNYKIVRKKQFACNLMHVGRDGKLPIAICDIQEGVITSPAYYVFEIKDTEEILPEYLMMWFRRPEFDREASFFTDADVRGGLDKFSFNDMYLPIPSINEQKRIVSDYQKLTKKIQHNEIMIQKLEETALTIYRKMFIDNIDTKNLPEGWEHVKLEDVADFSYGKLAKETECGNIPIFSGYAITGYTNIKMFEKQHIIVIARGDSGSGKVCLSPNRFFLTNLAIAIILKDEYLKFYLYYHLLNSDLYSLRSGSAQAQITINNLKTYNIILPPVELYTKFYEDINIINSNKQIIIKEIESLKKIQNIYLTTLVN